MGWIDDIKDPKVRDAYRIVGNQDSVSLRNMIRALELPISQFFNTPEDNERLAAAKVIREYQNKQKRAK